MNSREKEVYFDKWCKFCKYWATDEDKDPCNECLLYGANIDSHKPYMYQEAK